MADPDFINDVNEVLAEEPAEPIEPTHEAEQLPEAPASATIRVWIKGYGVMFTIRTLSNGQDAAVKLAQRVERFVDHAELKGWKNKWDEPVARVAPVNPNAPICKFHNKPMVFKQGVSKNTGKSYAFWTCGEKLADGSWCDYKPPKNNNEQF